MALSSVLESFPPVSFAVGYGSGVFPQKGYVGKVRAHRRCGDRRTSAAIALNAQPSLIDLLLICDDPSDFHAANLEFNPHHYSWPCTASRSVRDALQRAGAGVFFLPFCSVRCVCRTQHTHIHIYIRRAYVHTWLRRHPQRPAEPATQVRRGIDA